MILKIKCSDEVLWKKTEKSEKMYKLFNTIGKEKIARIRFIPLSYVLNLTIDETKYVMAEVLTQKVWWVRISLSSLGHLKNMYSNIQSY